MKYIILLSVLVLACQPAPPSEEQLTKWKEEIRQAELSFSKMSETEGMDKAFLTFSAEDVILKRGPNLIMGKKGIQEMYDTNPPNGTLTWAPDFVDVSSSGDLGYTYGKFKLVRQDSTGQEMVNEGIFHTVWKRQDDGSWKFVWD